MLAYIVNGIVLALDIFLYLLSGLDFLLYLIAAHGIVFIFFLANLMWRLNPIKHKHQTDVIIIKNATVKKKTTP